MEDRFKVRVWNNRTKEYVNEKGINTIYKGVYNATMLLGLFQYLKNDKQIQAIAKDFEFEQCTGAKDCYKDLIYEGDILEIWEDRGISYVEVVWNAEQKKWDVEGDTEADYDFWELVDREVGDKNNDVGVVGNIHENAELLGGK